MAKLTAARNCWAKVSGALPAITLCYEVGYDAFCLARFLKARGIECLVVDPGSLQVNRRGRRVKTDRVDVKMLLRTPDERSARRVLFAILLYAAFVYVAFVYIFMFRTVLFPNLFPS
jgi:hypothetical protein